MLQVCSSKVQPTAHEQSVISALNSTSGGPDGSQLKKRKRKKPKGPNPLSVKRSRKVFSGSRDSSGGGVSQSKVMTLQIHLELHVYTTASLI